ncbi:MAG TPA: MCP four helix bundle domain-containing protein [Verrucomicrobiae bacterium]|jgi:signal transduction histidine kinase/CheY-like chemotaxis protein
MNLRRLPISQQVSLTIAALCAILLAIGGLFLFGLRAIDRRNQTQQFQALNKLAVIDDLAQDVGEIQAQVLRQILASNQVEIERIDQSIHEVGQTNAAELSNYKKLNETAEERLLYETVMQARKAYWQQTEPLLALSRANNDSAAQQLAIAKQAPAYDRYLRAIDKLVDCVETNVGETTKSTARLIEKIRVIGDILVGVAILIVVAAGFNVAQFARRLKEDNRLLQSEVTERKKAEQQLNLEYAVSRILAESATFQECVQKTLGIIGMAFKHHMGVFWMLDHRAGVLRCTEMWNGDGASMEAFSTASRGQTFAKGVGLPGRVWASGEAVWIADLAKDSNFSRGNVAAQLGLRGALAFPIMTASGLGGVMEFFGHETNAADDGALRVCTSVGIQLGRSFDLKRVQEHLVQSQKNETVGKLAGGIAHEFNSIMTAIIGQSEMMLNDLPSGSPLSRATREIGKAAERAAGLTRQLLAYGRKQMLRLEILDLNKVLVGMDNIIHHLMGRDTDVRIVPGPGPKIVKADVGQIEQVITNIAMNAADVMPNGGKLTLETSAVTLEQEYVNRMPDLKPGPYVMLAITDTGTGMSEEVKRRIFEPFFSTKDVGKGTGLGLATCHGIVKQCNGHIAVYSELGRGATFKIYLPSAEGQAVALAPPRSSDTPRGSETILMVEDDPDLREMAQELLRRLGYTVLAAADGLEALNLAHQKGIGHIDLLFTDVVMPHMSGKELSDRIRSLFPRTKILFTSAYTQNAIVHQGVLDEGVILLQKPFTPSGLAQKIRELLDARA